MLSQIYKKFDLRMADWNPYAKYMGSATPPSACYIQFHRVDGTIIYICMLKYIFIFYILRKIVGREHVLLYNNKLLIENPNLSNKPKCFNLLRSLAGR